MAPGWGIRAPGLTQSHWPEWRRAGLRRLVHIVRIHLADRLENVMRLLPMPVLVLRGRDDELLTPEWATELTRSARCGRLEEMPGAHTFPWKDPAAWSEPIRRFTAATHLGHASTCAMPEQQ